MLPRLATKTAGVAEPLRHALRTRADGIRAAFVYGSVAKGSDKVGSDVERDHGVLPEARVHASIGGPDYST